MAGDMAWDILPSLVLSAFAALALALAAIVVGVALCLGLLAGALAVLVFAGIGILPASLLLVGALAATAGWAVIARRNTMQRQADALRPVSGQSDYYFFMYLDEKQP